MGEGWDSRERSVSDPDADTTAQDPPVAHIERRPNRPKQWRVRYRDPSGGHRSRSFARKVDAERFLTKIQADLLHGEWTDPRLAQTTIAEWSQRWLTTKTHLKPKTLESYESLLRNHILPAFGTHQLRHLNRITIEEWMAQLRASGLGPSGQRQARQVLHNLAALAVDAGYIPTNPVERVPTPRQTIPEMLFLTATQVEHLAHTIEAPNGTLVHLLAYGGLRWGEAAALRRARIHPDRNRVDITEAVTEPGGKLHYGTTKNHRNRTITTPPFLTEELRDHLDTHVAPDPQALVFTTPAGTPLRNTNFRRHIWTPALQQAGLPEGLRIHDLRHTCASLLIAAGANPKAVQAHLGHSSITVTLDRYTHLFPADTDTLILQLSAIRSQALAAQGRPKSNPDELELPGP